MAVSQCTVTPIERVKRQKLGNSPDSHVDKGLWAGGLSLADRQACFHGSIAGAAFTLRTLRGPSACWKHPPPHGDRAEGQGTKRCLTSIRAGESHSMSLSSRTARISRPTIDGTETGDAFGRLKTRGGKNSRASRKPDTISAGETGISSKKWTRWMVDRQPSARSPAKATPMRCFGAGAARQRPANHASASSVAADRANALAASSCEAFAARRS